MPLNFFDPRCQCSSARKKFGLCDPGGHSPAYLDEENGQDWIAVVQNDYLESVNFSAIDCCIDMFRADGSMAKRCDGMLLYQDKIIFVELKSRKSLGAQWVKDAEEQLRETILEFEKTADSENFKRKAAYISNSEKPRFRISQLVRMQKFAEDTGYILRIEGRINID